MGNIKMTHWILIGIILILIAMFPILSGLQMNYMEQKIILFALGLNAGVCIWVLIYGLVLFALKDNSEEKIDCDCHMFIGGSGKKCPDCKKNGCGFCKSDDALSKEDSE